MEVIDSGAYKNWAPIKSSEDVDHQTTVNLQNGQ